MKKVISALLALVMALSIGSMNAFAAMSIKNDYFSNGKVSTPDAPFVEFYPDTIYLWITQPSDILNLASQIMLDSGSIYDTNYKISDIKSYKEVDLSVDGGAWFSTTDKVINSDLFTYDSSFIINDNLNGMHTIDKIVGIKSVFTHGNYIEGDAVNNGILNNCFDESKYLDYNNHKFSFRVRYRVEIEYQSGTKETIYSDWSQATSVGKGASVQTIPTLSSKPEAPTINTVDSFTNSSGAQFYVGVDFPLSVYKDEVYYFANGEEPEFKPQVQYRVNGGEWNDKDISVSAEPSGSTINDFFAFIVLGDATFGDTVDIRVRTYESDSRISDWSNIATVIVSEKGYINPNPKKYSSGQGTPAKEPAIKTMTEGASEAQVDKFIQSLKSEADPKGTKFSFLVARQKKVTNNSITITWNKAKKASYYVVYGAKCGKTAYKKIKKVKTNTFTQKKLKKGTYYKYVVAAFDKNGKLLGSCNTLHIATKGGKVCNFKKVTTAAKKNQVTLAKKGKYFKLKAKAIKDNKLKEKTHRTIRYESTNKKIATVDKTGKITAKKKGTCYVYAYAQNGTFAKIKVTVKK